MSKSSHRESRMQIREPYKVLVEMRDDLGISVTAEFGETSLATAIMFAKAFSEGGWFEVVDRFTGNVVATSAGRPKE